MPTSLPPRPYGLRTGSITVDRWVRRPPQARAGAPNDRLRATRSAGWKRSSTVRNTIVLFRSASAARRSSRPGAARRSWPRRSNLWSHVKVYPEGGENQLHAHPVEDHLFLVLAGQATFGRWRKRVDRRRCLRGDRDPACRGIRVQKHGRGDLVMIRVGAPGRVLDEEKVRLEVGRPAWLRPARRRKGPSRARQHVGQQGRLRARLPAGGPLGLRRERQLRRFSLGGAATT